LNRDPHIDALKGFAILLVILGHAIQYNVPAYDDNPLFRAIYSFHMPLFMFLSGYVAWNRQISILNKFMALVVPFVSWHLLNYVLVSANHGTDFTVYIIRWIKSPDYGLWFLWVLFINFCILVAVQWVAAKLGDVRHTATLAAAIVLLQAVPMNILGMDLVKWHIAFFGAGYCIASAKDSLAAWKRPLQLLSLVAFPLLASTWYRTHGPTFEVALSTLFASSGMPISRIVLIAYRFLVPLFGIAFSFALIRAARSAPFCPVLCYLIGFGAVTIKVATAFSIALALSLAASFLLRRSRLLSMLLLGRRGQQAPVANPA
jgi:hypothetical protein